MRRVSGALVVLGAGLILGACASGAQVDTLRADLDRVDVGFVAADPAAQEEAPVFDGQLAGYLLYAMRQDSMLQARYATWRAAVEKIGAADKWPEPVLTYGLFLRRVETRVGAQRQRFGLRFTVPWPSKLGARSDEAVLEARAAGQGFEAEVFALRRRVSDAYWRLWVVGQRRALMRDQVAVLEQLMALMRHRLEVGQATVADLSLVQLTLLRLQDDIESLDGLEEEARARLLVVVGAPQGSLAPLAEDVFRQARPTEADDVLKAEARAHPKGQVLALKAEARRVRAEGAEADRYPDLIFGVDGIDTAEMEGSALPDNGKDPIIANFGVTLPLWGGAYGAKAAAARFEGEALEHRRLGVEEDMEASVVQALSRMKDSNRRLTLFQSTLIPQAETTFASALDSYEVKGSNLAVILLAYRDLSALRLERVNLQARHAMTWAWLESVVGRAVGSEMIP